MMIAGFVIILITMCYKLINDEFKGDDHACVWSNEFLTTLSYILPKAAVFFYLLISSLEPSAYG